MSGDESPTGGHQPSARDSDPNSSIIGKVRSRVSSILPQTFTRWFSPTRAENSQNGNIRRRRDRDREDALDRDEDDSQNTEDSDTGEDEEKIAPPLKRAKLNLEESTTTETYQHKTQKVSRHFLSSTPTTVNRRRCPREEDTTCNFESATTSTFTTTRIQEVRPDGFNEEVDTPEVAPRPHIHREQGWGDSSRISSRRSLNIPSSSTVTRRLPDLRRQSLKRTALGQTRTSHPVINEVDLREEQDQDASDSEEKNTDIAMSRKSREIDNVALTNGLDPSTNIVVQVDDASDSGDSQCSSLQRPKDTDIVNKPSKALRTSMGNGLNFHSHLEGKKSLFSDKNMPHMLNNSTTSLTSLNRRQSFNASLYGSTSALSDSRILNTTSPFYKGRTTYGGASAYSKYSQQVQRTLRTPTLIRPTSSLSTLSSSSNSLVQNTDASSAISNTAKRILELMNQFTTPLTDAKKMANNIKVPALIAHKKRFGEPELQANRAIRMSSPRTPYSRPSLSKTGKESSNAGPPISELQVPSMSQLLQMKKLQNATERVREIANSSKSILNREEEYKLPSETKPTDSSSSNRHVSKIKNKVTSTRVSKKAAIEEQETLPAVNLPDIPLPLMKSVPKIDIQISSATTKQSPSLSAVKSNTSTMFKSDAKSSAATSGNLKSNSITSPFSNSKGNAFAGNFTTVQKGQASGANIPTFSRGGETVNNKKSSNSIEFKFSAPIPVETKIKSNVEPIDNFRFSAPVPINNSKDNFKCQPIEKTTNKDNFKYQPIEKTTNKDSLKITDSISVNKVPTPHLKSGSVLDALKKPIAVEKVENVKPIVGFGSQFSAPSDKWECSVCMIRNDNNRDKCEACETPRKTATPAVSVPKPEVKLPPIANTFGFGDVFKPKSDTWECDICMVRNDADKGKCVACGASKPGASSAPAPSLSAASTAPKSLDSGFKSIVEQQSSKWECSVCMTRNEQNRLKCVCCEQAKPGAVNTDAPKFSFGASGSKFTFGFGAQKEEEVRKTEGDKDKTATPVGLKFTNSLVPSKPTGGFTFGSPAVPPATATTSALAPTTLGFKPPTTATGKDVPDNTSLFGGSLQQNKPKEDVKPAAGNENNQQGSAFKPIGGFAFGATNANPQEAKLNIEPVNKPNLTFGASTSSTSTDGNKSTTEVSTVQKADSTAEVKAGFKFGVSAAPAEPKKPESTAASGFSWSKPNSTPPTFGSQKSEIPMASGLFSSGQVTSSAPTTSTTSTIAFGIPQTLATSNAPLFGSVSSSTTTSSTTAAVSNTPSFGSIASGAAVTTTPSLFGSVASSPKASFGSLPQQQNNNSFGSSFSASTSSSQQNNQPSNLFAFGTTPKTEANKSVFGSVSSTTSKPFAFGTSNPPSNSISSTPFVFGGNAQKPADSTPVFGSVTNNSAGGAAPAALPTFGSFSSPAANAPQSQTTPAFGQQTAPGTAAATGAVVATFGSSINPTAPANATPFGSSNPPVFGSPSAAAGAVFGSSAASFGSTPAPAFGATNTTFGTSPAAPTFGAGFVADGPPEKKVKPAFNFGATAAQNSTGAFQFGANNNNKPAFNFAASNTTFNFTGSQETAPNALFQFSAAPAANNIFAPTPAPGTPSSQARNRKFRTAARRTQPRQANS